MAKLQIKIGKDNAPCKVIVFLSPTCTFCPEFYSKHLPKIISIGGSQIQAVVYPVIRNDVDLSVIGQMGVMGANGKKAFATFFSVSGEDREDYQKQFMAKVGIDDFDHKSKKFTEAVVNSLNYTTACTKGWKIKATPGVVVNGAIMQGLNDVNALYKCVELLTKG